MEPIEVLLSDKYNNFTKKIRELALKKQIIEQEYRGIYNVYQEYFTDIDNQILELQKDFETWKKEFFSITDN